MKRAIGVNQKNLKEVVSPEIAGYTPDQEKDRILSQFHMIQKDIVRIVTYKANPQKITVNYVDDTTGKTLATKELNGKSDESQAIQLVIQLLIMKSNIMI